MVAARGEWQAVATRDEWRAVAARDKLRRCQHMVHGERWQREMCCGRCQREASGERWQRETSGQRCQRKVHGKQWQRGTSGEQWQREASGKRSQRETSGERSQHETSGERWQREASGESARGMGGTRRPQGHKTRSGWCQHEEVAGRVTANRMAGGASTQITRGSGGGERETYRRTIGITDTRNSRGVIRRATGRGRGRAGAAGERGSEWGDGVRARSETRGA